MSSSSSATRYDAQQSINGRPNNSQGGAGAAAILGSYVQVALPDANKQLTVMVADTSAYQQSGKASDLTSWTTYRVADWFSSVSSGQFQVNDLISAVALGGYFYFFWSVSGKSGQQAYFALRTSPDLTSRTWAQLGISGDSGHAYQGNAAVMALPDARADMAGKLGCVLLYHSAADYYFRTVQLDPALFVPNSIWPITDLHNVSTTPLTGIDSRYTSLSATWLHEGSGLTAIGPTNADTTVVDNVGLVVTLGNKQQNASYCGDLLRAFSYAYNAALDRNPSERQTKVEVVNFNQPLAFDNGSSVTLCPTPDGQVLAQYQYKAKAKYLVFQPGASSSQVGQWAPYSVTGNMPDRGTYLTPATVFVPMAPGTGNAPVAVPDPSGKSKTYTGCPLQDYVQLSFTCDQHGQPYEVTAYWGEFFTIVAYNTNKHTGDRQYVATLLADTFPYPVPANNYNKDPFCEYDYLSGNSTSTSLTYDLRSSLGVKMETTDLIAGLGLKAESNLAVGFTAALDTSHGTTSATELTVETRASGDAGLGYQPVSPCGAVFSNSVPGTIYTDVALVLRRGDSAPAGTLAVALRPGASGSASPAAATFNTFLYTPGNINSYDADAINKHMKTLFNNLSDADKQDFVINGEDFSSFYTGQDGYVNSVVKRFGTPIFGPGGNQPYLSYSFSSTSSQRTSYQATSAFTAGGSLFIDASAYAGLAWSYDEEVEVGFLGIIEVPIPAVKSEGYVMVGAELSSSIGSSTTSTTEWGVSLTTYNNPLTGDENYTVRMYILKPSPLWVRELKHFGSFAAGGLDTTNSAPVRILFTVPDSMVSSSLQARMQRDFGS